MAMGGFTVPPVREALPPVGLPRHPSRHRREVYGRGGIIPPTLCGLSCPSGHLAVDGGEVRSLGSRPRTSASRSSRGEATCGECLRSQSSVRLCPPSHQLIGFPVDRPAEHHRNADHRFGVPIVMRIAFRNSSVFPGSGGQLPTDSSRWGGGHRQRDAAHGHPPQRDAGPIAGIRIPRVGKA